MTEHDAIRFPRLRVTLVEPSAPDCFIDMADLTAAPNETAAVSPPWAALPSRDMLGAGAVMGPDVTEAVVRISGVARKGAKGPIMSAKGFAINRGLHEYRIVSVQWRLEYELAPLLLRERVESDICLVVLDDNLANSVSSGEEIVCVHEHFVCGVQTSRLTSYAKGKGKGRKQTVWEFGDGGLQLARGFRVEVGSVSSVWSPEGRGGIVSPPTVAARRAGHRDPLGLAIKFKLTLVRADVVAPRGVAPDAEEEDRSAAAIPPTQPVTSVRSSIHNRGREIFPGFTNIGDAPVSLRALGVFVSVLKPGHPLEAHVIKIEVDGQVVRSFCAPPHDPMATSHSSSALVPLHGLSLAPGSVVTASHMSLGTATIALDVALYLISTARPGALAPRDLLVLPTRDCSAVNSGRSCVERRADDASVNVVSRDHAYADMDGDGHLDRVRAVDHANGDVSFMLARGGAWGLESERLWFVSTCCRGGGDGVKRFINSSHIITRQPPGSNASVALLSLDYCRAAIHNRAHGLAKLGHGMKEIVNQMHPWCFAFKSSKREFWRHLEFSWRDERDEATPGLSAKKRARYDTLQARHIWSAHAGELQMPSEAARSPRLRLAVMRPSELRCLAHMSDLTTISPSARDTPPPQWAQWAKLQPPRAMRSAAVEMGPGVADAVVHVSGTARKGENGAIMSAKGFVINKGTYEYRVARVEWRLECARAALRAAADRYV